MTKHEEIDKLLEQNDGYLYTKDVENAEISRTYLASYVKERDEIFSRLQRVSPKTMDKLGDI